MIYLVKKEIGLFWSNLFSDDIALNSLWFIYNLLIVYILAPFINAIRKKFANKTFFILLCFLYLILNISEGLLYNNFICSLLRTFIYIIQFTFGCLMSYMIKALDNKRYFISQIIALILVTLILLSLTYFVVGIKDDTISPMFYLIGNTKTHSFFATIMALIITPMIFRIKIKHTSKDASLLLLLIYLIHPIVIQGLGYVLKYDKLICFLIYPMINFVVTYVFARFLIIIFKRLAVISQ